MPRSDSMTVVSVIVIFRTFSSGKLSLRAMTNFSLLLAKSEPSWKRDFPPFGFSSSWGGLGASGVTADMVRWRNENLSFTPSNTDTALVETKMSWGQCFISQGPGKTGLGPLQRTSCRNMNSTRFLMWAAPCFLPKREKKEQTCVTFYIPNAAKTAHLTCTL